jgi:drug/metabolite transporter (DMT)-like permease
VYARVVRSDALLLLAAAIWGFAFVAQRAGMAHVGPFTFNAIRFALGSLPLVPLAYLRRRGRVMSPTTSSGVCQTWLVRSGSLAGLALFAGASLQQVGIVYTTAGKAGFITGLYIVIVPFLGLFQRSRPTAGAFLGALIAVAGLYFLALTGSVRVSPGDLLVLGSAFFWAAHVILVGWLVSFLDPISLALRQFATCSALSLLTACALERTGAHAVLQAAIPILYAGLASVGIAYTLQVVAQRHARPAHAAIILGMESVFAALGGWLMLGESLPARGVFGCALMLTGAVISVLTRRSDSVQNGTGQSAA